MSRPFDETASSALQTPSPQAGRSSSEPADTWQLRSLPSTESAAQAVALAASLEASTLAQCADVEQLARAAFDLARQVVGLERVAIYLREPCSGRVRLRGTWGVGAEGQVTDEHHLTHELSPYDGLMLLDLRRAGACALYRPRALRTAIDGEQILGLGVGWVMVTPLIWGNDLVGVLYNDAALSGSAPDPSKQVAAAVLASFVGLRLGTTQPGRWEELRSATEQGQLAARVRERLQQDPGLRGKVLAAQLGVSPGHLARAFRRETGLSLVEYRNRQRIARFSEALAQSDPALSKRQVAAASGFGSYAQLNRIQKKLGHTIRRYRAESGPAASALLARAPRSPSPWPPLR